SRILLLGMAYKPDIDDVRESPSLDIHALLKTKGAIIDFNDPFVDEVRFDGIYAKSTPLNADSLKSYDCVVIATNHKVYDYQMIVSNSKLVIDTRNATAKIKDEKIIRLGAMG
ncbi:MAG: UDP-N-acetyl-D-glucosamine dehydrogenase, partial [Candidatus Marinimicrobia bacterium CG_4_9_14_3_um_filter_48_9]